MNCEVKFLRNGNAVFYAGSEMEAVIQLNLTESMIVNEITCHFQGRAKCEWTLDISRYNLQKFSDRVDYLDKVLTIVEPTPDGLELPPDEHNFNFTFLLPSNLPTTFKSKFGSIKYKILVTVKFSNSSEINFELPFVVIQPLNLNDVRPSLAVPHKLELERNFNFQIASSDLSMMVVIPQKGFVPGQTIEVLIQIENLGRSKVKYLKIALKKIVIYTCRQPKFQEKKVIENEVKEVIYQEILPKRKRNFLRPITVPPLPPNIDNCHIIRVAYQLRVKAKTIGWNKSPKLKFPITIGTTPIANENSEIESVVRGDPPPYVESIALLPSTDSSSDDDD